jgi:hypothetical protein
VRRWRVAEEPKEMVMRRERATTDVRCERRESKEEKGEEENERMQSLPAMSSAKGRYRSTCAELAVCARKRGTAQNENGILALFLLTTRSR